MIDEVARRISPTDRARKEMIKTCERLISLTEKELGLMGVGLKAEIFGSASRDTWLVHEKDIDLFIKFPIESSKADMEKIVTELGKRLLAEPLKRYAEHPYVTGGFEGYTVEFVPCYDVSDASKRLSAVDRTPFHDRYVRSRIKGLQKDVRLLKQFLKGIGVYGAETKVEGFSGYLCELLVIKYGSFEKVINAASKWKPPVLLWLEEKAEHPDSNMLVFLDPTDKERNVASAVSNANLSLFIYACNQFLKNPSDTFFYPKTRPAKKKDVLKIFNSRGTHVVLIVFKTPDVIDDILYPQLRKACQLFKRRFEMNDFKVLTSGFKVRGEETLIAFEFPSKELSSAREHMGPPVNSDNESTFISKHTNSDKALCRPYIHQDRWRVFLKRDYRRADDFLGSLLIEKDLQSTGIPSYVARGLKKGYTVNIDSDAIDMAPGFFAELLDPVFPWEV